MRIWNQAQQGTFIHPQIHQLLGVGHGMKEIKVSRSVLNKSDSQCIHVGLLQKQQPGSDV